MQAKLALLQKELPNLEAAASHLAYSLERCKASNTWLTPSLEQMERLESLAARFARLSDLLVQRIFRLIDELELVGTSTVLDRIYRAEKRGWLQADKLIQIRELRNLIAHEYASDSMQEIYAAITVLALDLLQAVPKIVTEGHALFKRYSTA